MTLPRIYLPRPLRTGDLVAATPDQARYLLTVLRMGAGDRLLVFDGANGEYEARIRPRTPEAIDLEIGGRGAGAAGGGGPRARSLAFRRVM